MIRIVWIVFWFVWTNWNIFAKFYFSFELGWNLQISRHILLKKLNIWGYILEKMPAIPKLNSLIRFISCLHSAHWNKDWTNLTERTPMNWKWRKINNIADIAWTKLMYIFSFNHCSMKSEIKRPTNWLNTFVIYIYMYLHVDYMRILMTDEAGLHRATQNPYHPLNHQNVNFHF